MSRLPFDPDRVAAPVAKPRRKGGDRTVTVSQAAAMIKLAVAEALPAKLRIVGEISNFSNRAHWFFSLKDDESTLRCVCFASTARRIGFPVHDGLEVIATGRIDYYEAQGQLQLYVDRLEPVGQGALELRFRALCDELRKAGYFDPARKQPLPLMPQCIAVVTSRNAAALQDVIDTAARRWPGCRLILCDVRVQGSAAAAEIAAAIDDLSQRGQALGIEAIIITRGGGSVEDLWAFNERIVADAIVRCTLPTVAAIGHETDTTIAELVADARCATPTQAAMMLIPDRQALGHQLHQIASRLSLLMQRCYERCRHRLDAATRRPFLQRPEAMYDPLVKRLDDLTNQLHAAARRRITTSHQQLSALRRQLESIGPRQVLQRGYSYTLGPSNVVLRSTAEIDAGDRITTVLADGRFTSKVDGPAARRRPTRRSTKKRAQDDQISLFDQGQAAQSNGTEQQ